MRQGVYTVRHMINMQTIHTDSHTHTQISLMEMWEAWLKLPPAKTTRACFLWSSWFPVTKRCMLSPCSFSWVMSPDIACMQNEVKSRLFCIELETFEPVFPENLQSQSESCACWACMSNGLVTSSVNCYGLGGKESNSCVHLHFQLFLFTLAYP